MNTNRANEIINSFTSFRKNAYYKSEELPELLKLQEEIVKLTFGDDKADLEKQRIWDVERYFEEKNKELNGITTAELEDFEEDCKDFCNMIKGIISGSKGEARAFRSLDKVRCPNSILKNVELTTDEVRTELDAVVVTKGGVSIVEVKNTAKNVFIDEEGNYYRTGEYLRWDSNIGAKMMARENLVKEMLSAAGYESVPVRGIVVFTDNRIEVRNRCEGLTTCFVSQLPHLIDENQPTGSLEEADIEVISQAIEARRCKEAYPIKFDATQLKQHFAELMVAVEQAEREEEVIPVDSYPEWKHVQKNHKEFRDTLRKVFKPSYRRAAAAAVMFAARVMIVAANTRNI